MKRRYFVQLSTALATQAIVCESVATNILSKDQNLKVFAISAGDVTNNGATIWSRANKPSRMFVDLSLSPLFEDYQRIKGEEAKPEKDFNTKITISSLKPGVWWHYRVFFSHNEGEITSQMEHGRFKTAPKNAQDIKFCWSGDTAGQGFGIDSKNGGMLTYSSINNCQPDFFIHCGDLIYADNPIPKSIECVDGSYWINEKIQKVNKVAISVQDFRERYYYNFMDQHLRKLHKNVSVYQTWDDHEVKNNWYPDKQITDERYEGTPISSLINSSRQALLECNPIQDLEKKNQLYRQFKWGEMLDIFMLDMRSERGMNSENTADSLPSKILGTEQLEWLKQSLLDSKATWKLLVSSVPIGLIIHRFEPTDVDGIANSSGELSGREYEIADLLSFIKKREIKNTHFLSADVHYCSSQHYTPEKAIFKDFQPFWEFVSGPLHAGTFGPNKLDNTFGPTEIFKGIPSDLKQNSPPSLGYQFFGQIEIDVPTQSLTVSHINRVGKLLWKKRLMPHK